MHLKYIKIFKIYFKFSQIYIIIYVYKQKYGLKQKERYLK